jgi:hypothetical protein
MVKRIAIIAEFKAIQRELINKSEKWQIVYSHICIENLHTKRKQGGVG